MPAKKWTKDRVISEFKQYVDAGCSIKPKALKENRNDLLIQIRRKFGSFKTFIESQGFDYEEVVGFKRWCKERIIAEVQARHRGRKSIVRMDIEKDDPALLSSMIKHFGDFRAAIEACGFNYEDCIGFQWWNKDKIKDEFTKLYFRDDVHSVECIRSVNRGLDHAIRNYFGSYDALCEELGLDVNNVRAEVYQWQKDDLLKVLREMKTNGEPLNVMSVQSKFPSAVKVAERYFGSYENALMEIGERYSDHVEDHSLASYYGHKFESLLVGVFEALKINFEYHFRGFNGLVPDFYCAETDTILDAKLSSWSVFNCKTYEKYKPKCNNLIVVYLRGSDIEHQKEGLELRHISYYYEALEKSGAVDLLREMQVLEEEVNHIPIRSEAVA